MWGSENNFESKDPWKMFSVSRFATWWPQAEAVDGKQAKIIIEMCPKGRVRSKYKIAPKEITRKNCNREWV